MLKLWFPQIPTQPVSAASSVAASPARSFQDSSSSTPPHKHRDQLHIPVKVRKRTPPCMQQPPCGSLFTKANVYWVLKITSQAYLHSCSFCRSADSAGQVRTPPRPPLCFSSALASVQKRCGWNRIVTKGMPILLCHWRLMQTKLRQMWTAKASVTRSQRERTVTWRSWALCQNTKQVKALSQTWRGFTSHPSCAHGRPALRMKAPTWQVAPKTSPSPQRSRRAGRAVPLPKTAPSPLQRPTSSPKIWRSRPGAKASPSLDSRARVRTQRPVRVQINLPLSRSSLYPGCAPPP